MTLVERALVTLAHQLRSRQEITPGAVAIENAKRQVKSESVMPAVATTGLARPTRATRRDDNNPGLDTVANDLQREPINLREIDNPSNKSVETESAKILDSLIGIQLLDRLMLDAAHPLAAEISRAMRGWYSSGLASKTRGDQNQTLCSVRPRDPEVHDGRAGTVWGACRSNCTAPPSGPY